MATRRRAIGNLLSAALLVVLAYGGYRMLRGDIVGNLWIIAIVLLCAVIAESWHDRKASGRGPK